MADIRKTWLKAPGPIRVILAFLYVLAAFGIPLNHTCQLVDKDVHNCHSGCGRRRLLSDEHVEVQYATAFNQNGLTETDKSHNLHCPACLYSLTSKAFRFCSNASSYSTQIVVRTQVLLQLSFTKQLEWFCSAPLRAPPGITS